MGAKIHASKPRYWRLRSNGEVVLGGPKADNSPAPIDARDCVDGRDRADPRGRAPASDGAGRSGEYDREYRRYGIRSMLMPSSGVEEGWLCRIL